MITTALPRAPLAAGLVLAAAAAIALALVAPLSGGLVDAAAAGDPAPVAFFATAIAALTLAHLGAAWAAEVLLARTGAVFSERMRRHAIERVLDGDLRTLRDLTPDDVLSRATWEIDQVAAFARHQLAALLIAVCYLGATLVIFASQSWALALAAVAVYAPLGTLVYVRFARRSAVAFEAEAAALAALTGTIVEGAGVRDALQDDRSAEFWTRRVATRATTVLDAVDRTISALNVLPWLGAVEALALVVILGLGGAAALAGLIPLGVLTMFVVASGTIFVSFEGFAGALSAVQVTRTYLRRVRMLLAGAAPAADEPARQGTTRNDRAGLRARGVSFGYGVTDVLSHIDIDFAPGSRTALVGASGAGKTTLAKVLAGLYAPRTGSVSLDGADVHRLPAAVLRRRLVLATQDAHVFAGSLVDNALAPRHLVERAVRRLGLEEWVVSIGGVEADLERGERLSTGERQLVALVRAFSRDADVLILDEATARLDAGWTARVRTALADAPGTTVIAVAHGRELIDAMDHVVRIPMNGETP